MSEPQMQSAFAAPDPADLAPLFPGYEIEGLIAAGGMGAVYRAVQKSLERSVAIKILPQEFSNDAAFCAGFEAEAKAMARLNHPNLIGVYDFGEVGGMLYIVMEYVPGQSLFHSAHGLAIDPAEVSRLVTGICLGLAHAHENGIIHRDIKPSNILLDLNANPKIGDFGLARPAGHQIQAGEDIFGTPHYTAPEVILSPASVDHRADIFSVGVLLHELLTGRLPAEDHRTATAIAMCDPRYDAIIRRATDPRPERRYSSALEIASELQTIATTAGPKVLRTIPAAAPQSRRRKGKAAYRSQKTSAAPYVVIALILIAVAALALKYQSLHKSAPEQTEQTPATSEESAPEPVVETPAEAPEPLAPEPTVIPEPPPEVPAPEPEIPEPVFDVPEFLENARKIMRERAAPFVLEHQGSLKKNTDECVKILIREIAKIERRESRDEAVAAMEEFLKELKNNNNRIPPELHDDLVSFAECDAAHAGFLKNQQDFEDNFASQLSSLAATYILGIEKQIERLMPENDPGAVKLLEKEIELVREVGDHFPGLIIDQAAGSNER